MALDKSQLDWDKIKKFSAQVSGDIGAAMLGALSYIGDRLGIFSALAEAGSVTSSDLAKRTGLEEGVAVKPPIVELYYKSDPLGDPMITEEHVRMLRLASPKEVAWLKRTALKINAVLRPLLKRKGLILVDFKLEFGRHGGKLYLGDEISPDTCRLWDADTLEKLDKDRFRRDLGNVEEAYQEVYRRIVGSGS